MWNELIPVFVHVKHSQDQEWFFPLERPNRTFLCTYAAAPEMAAGRCILGNIRRRGSENGEIFFLALQLERGIYTREIMTQIPPTCRLISPLLPASLPRWKKEGISRRHSPLFRAQQQQQYSRQQFLSSPPLPFLTIKDDDAPLSLISPHIPSGPVVTLK